MPSNNLIAYFSSYDEAEEAATRLRGIGVDKVELYQRDDQTAFRADDLDNVSYIPGSFIGAPINLSPSVSGNGTFPSAFVGPGIMFDNSDSNQRRFQGFYLEAAVKDQNYDRAVDIVKESNGSVD